MLKKKLFGTDGIRGRANSAEMNTELAVSVGRAIAYYVRNSSEPPQIVIGKDTRLSGYMIENALASGITSMGINAVKTGSLPTPGIAFICRSMRSRFGIAVSASHNPPEQNGIKLFDENGFKLGEEQELEIERLIADGVPEMHLAESSKIGRVVHIEDAVGRYIQFLKGSFPSEMNLKGMKVAVDAANGSSYRVAPAVFSELGADVEVICNEPDGRNINEGCGALHPERLCDLTRRTGADIGIALDGDADRVILSDENGNVVNGDAILYISAKHLNSKKGLDRSTVVGTIMSNAALELALKKDGISLVRTDVGDHNVVAYMRANGLVLGGEPSGHIIYMHHQPSGDGVVVALQMLSIMRQSKKTLGELTGGFSPFPQRTLNVPVKKKIPFEEVGEIAELKRKMDKKLEGIGRTVLRYSGTEMIARVTVESNDEKTTAMMVEELAAAVKRCL